MRCIVCTKPIPEGRKRDAVTCTPKCSRIRKDFWRSRQDQISCRYCNKPSSPEERVLFGMWRRAHKKGTEDDQFAALTLKISRLVRENERLKTRLVELEAQ